MDGSATSVAESVASFGGLLAGADPARFCDLTVTAQGQCAGRDIFCDAGCGSYVGCFSNGDWGDQGGVGTDKGAVADGGGVLLFSVVVASDGSGANVDVGAEGGISEVGEVVGLGAAPDFGVFGLHEVADVGLRADLASGAQMGEGAQLRVVPDGCVRDDAVGANEHVVPKLGVLQDVVGSYAAV